MNQDTDEQFMRRALELARRAPFTSPNPKVGCVMVRDGRVVGEGYHEGAGRPHAEIVALSAAGDVSGATAYLTLEPCAHHGRTPPCAPALVAAGIRRVVVAMADPDERVNRRGLQHLSEEGVAVTTDVCASEARALNASYIHQRVTGRPYVSLKLALSLDGRLAAPDRSARWITGEASRTRVHRRRMEVDAVVVGSGTVEADDPALTVRAVQALRQPARILLDSTGRTPPAARLFDDGEVIVATTEHAPHDVQTRWKEAGAEVMTLPATADGVDLEALLDVLGRRGRLEILCEGGARLATSLLKADLVDRLEVHLGAVLLGRGGEEIGALGVTTMSDARRWKLLGSEAIGDDLVASYGRNH